MATVYEIATKIVMMNGISPVLALLGKEILGLEGGIKNLTKSFEGFGASAQVALGGLAVVAGTTVSVALGKLAEKGTELLNQQEQLQRMGISLAEVNRMTADGFARVAKEVPTARVSEYLRVIRELRGAVGDTPGLAEKLAPQALQVQALLANTTKGDQSEAFWHLMRSAEMKGIVTNEQKLKSFIDAVVPWILGTGGKVTPAGFQAFARKGGAAWINANLEKALPGMAVAIADLGGHTAGQSMMSLYQFVQSSHVMSKQQYDIMDKLGLIDRKKVKSTGFGGGFRQVEVGGIAGSLSHVDDLPGWVNDILMPAIDKMAGGRKAAAKAASSDEAFAQSVLAKIFQNRNQLRIALMWGMPEFRDQISKDAGIVGQVLTREEAYKEFSTKNPVGVQLAFKEQWESMLSAIGSPLMIEAMPVMGNIREFFTWFGDWANRHQEDIGIAGKFIASFAIGLTALGSTAIIIALTALAGPSGLLVGFAAGLAALAVFNWDQLVWGIKMVDEGFNYLSKSISNFFEFLKNLLPDWMLKKETALRGGGIGPLGRFSEGRLWPVYYGGMPFGGSYNSSGAISAGLGGSYNSPGGGALHGHGHGGGRDAAVVGGIAGVGKYNVKAAYDLIKAVGGTDEEARILAAISQAESRGNPLAHNYNLRTGDDSYGLWQINMLGRMGPERLRKYGLGSAKDLFDPATNARVALAMARAAHGYRDWSVYKHGLYKKYLSSSAEHFSSPDIPLPPLRPHQAPSHFEEIFGHPGEKHSGKMALMARGLNHGPFDDGANWKEINKFHSGEDVDVEGEKRFNEYMRNIMNVPHSPFHKATIHVHTHLDGKMVASNTVNHILRSSEHSRGAAYFDGLHTFSGADRQTATA